MTPWLDTNTNLGSVSQGHLDMNETLTYMKMDENETSLQLLLSDLENHPNTNSTNWVIK